MIFIESGGDNLAATFSPDLADLTIYVISVCQGEKIPRKGGPAITRSDLLVINKTDLAPHVGADLEVMRDNRRARAGAALRLHRPDAAEGRRAGHRLPHRKWWAEGSLRSGGVGWNHRDILHQSKSVAPYMMAKAFSSPHGETFDVHCPPAKGKADQPALLRRARRSRLRLPLDGAAQHARGGGQPFFAGRERRRQPVPDEPEPGSLFAHQGERPAVDRRQRPRDAFRPERAGSDGLGPARSDPPQCAARALRHACAFDTRDGAGLARRTPGCRPSTRTRPCSTARAR